MSATSGPIVELDGQEATPAGHDRRRAMLLCFLLCLAFGSAVVGRDGPIATTPVPEAAATLSLPRGVGNATLVSFPDRLANEQLPAMNFVPIAVRTTRGLAADPVRPGDGWVLMWTERGSVYWLTSEVRDTSDLLRLADDLH